MEKIAEAFESTKFSRFMESVKFNIDSQIESETERGKKSQLKEHKEKVQQYHWKLKKSIGKKSTSFKNIVERILKIEEITGQEVL